MCSHRANVAHWLAVKWLINTTFEIHEIFSLQGWNNISDHVYACLGIQYIIHLMHHRWPPLIFIKSLGGAANHTQNSASLQDELQRSSKRNVLMGHYNINRDTRHGDWLNWDWSIWAIIENVNEDGAPHFHQTFCYYTPFSGSFILLLYTHCGRFWSNGNIIQMNLIIEDWLCKNIVT